MQLSIICLAHFIFNVLQQINVYCLHSHVLFYIQTTFYSSTHFESVATHVRHSTIYLWRNVTKGTYFQGAWIGEKRGPFPRIMLPISSWTHLMALNYFPFFLLSSNFHQRRIVHMPASETRFQTANMKSDPLLAALISAIRSAQRQGYFWTNAVKTKKKEKACVLDRDNHFTLRLKCKYCISISSFCFNKSTL